VKVKDNQEVDILYIKMSDAKIVESDEDKKGVILDYAEDGSLVGIEILNASKTSLNPTKVEYEVA